MISAEHTPQGQVKERRRDKLKPTEQLFLGCPAGKVAHLTLFRKDGDETVNLSTENIILQSKKKKFKNNQKQCKEMGNVIASNLIWENGKPKQFWFIYHEPRDRR